MSSRLVIFIGIGIVILLVIGGFIGSSISGGSLKKKRMISKVN